jgi:hypothetical protein
VSVRSFALCLTFETLPQLFLCFHFPRRGSLFADLRKSLDLSDALWQVPAKAKEHRESDVNSRKNSTPSDSGSDTPEAPASSRCHVRRQLIPSRSITERGLAKSVSGAFFRSANQESKLFWDATKYTVLGADGVPVAKNFANSAPCLALGKEIFQEERDQLASFLFYLILQQSTPELKYRVLKEVDVTTTSVVGTFADTRSCGTQPRPELRVFIQSDEFTRGLSDTAVKGAAKKERAWEVAEGVVEQPLAEVQRGAAFNSAWHSSTSWCDWGTSPPQRRVFVAHKPPGNHRAVTAHEKASAKLRCRCLGADEKHPFLSTQERK